MKRVKTTLGENHKGSLSRVPASRLGIKGGVCEVKQSSDGTYSHSSALICCPEISIKTMVITLSTAHLTLKRMITAPNSVPCTNSPRRYLLLPYTKEIRAFSASGRVMCFVCAGLCLCCSFLLRKDQTSPQRETSKRATHSATHFI